METLYRDEYWMRKFEMLIDQLDPTIVSFSLMPSPKRNNQKNNEKIKKDDKENRTEIHFPTIVSYFVFSDLTVVCHGFNDSFEHVIVSYGVPAD
jgi:hypothetical protein